MKHGTKVRITDNAIFSDGDDTRRTGPGKELRGVIRGYLGDDIFRVEADDCLSGADDSCWDIHRIHLVEDSPEADLAALVFGSGDVIAMPNPDHFVKPPEERGGRVPSSSESALLLLAMSPHTRAVLHIVDKTGLAQADAALARTGWIEGNPWPNDKLGTRGLALKSIGELLMTLAQEAAFWQGIQNNPRAHPQYEQLSLIGDGVIKEFARIAAESRGARRHATMFVGLSLGLTESEMYQAEEISGEEA